MRLGDVRVRDPAFVFQLEVLDGYRIGVRVQVRERLILRHPAPEDVVGDHDLAGFVVQLEADVLPEVLE